MLRELRIVDRVKRIVPGDAWLRTHYEHALGLLYPSRHEGFGLPALEAMLCGCPVVTTALSSLPEVCGEAALYAGADEVDEWVRAGGADEDSERRNVDHTAAPGAGKA